MRKKKVASLAIIMAMVLGLAGCGNSKVKTDNVKAQAPAAETVEETENTTDDKTAKDGKAADEDGTDIGGMIKDVIKTGEVKEVDKDETIYVITDANGNKQNVIVSEWLKNKDHEDVIEDVSTLTDIENVKGDEEFTQDGNKVSWKANGNPIYYQGKTDKEVPVEVKVTYYLNDAEVTPEQIAGKSGKVKIRFDYINKAKEDGISVPFIMATGFFLDNSCFTNISVSNGKYISDGSKSVVIGFGFPGLTDDLKETSEKTGVAVPEYFEVTADTTDFKLDMTLTVAATGLVGDTIEDVDFSQIEGEINRLVGEYQDGVNKLASGIVSYTGAVSQIANGAAQVSSGASQVSDGASRLSEGTDQLYAGGITLGNALESADIGAGQLKEAFEGDNGVLAGSAKLSGGLQQLNGAVQAIELPEIPDASSLKFTEEQKAAATKAISEAAEKELAEKGVKIDMSDLQALSAMSDDEKVKAITEKAAAAAKEDPNVQKIIKDEKVQALIASTVNGIIDSKVEEYMASDEGKALVDSKVQEYCATMIALVMGTADKPSDLAIAAVAGAKVDPVTQATYQAMLGADPNTKPEDVKISPAALACDTETYNALLDEFQKQFAASAEDTKAMLTPAVKEGVKANIEANKKEEITKQVTEGYVQIIGNAFAAGYGNAYTELGKEMQDIAGKLEYIISVYTNKGVEYGLDQALTMVKSEMSTFGPKITSLKEGVAQLAEGAGKLDEGLNKLYKGVESLDDGLDQIYASVPTLTGGLRDLSNGAGSLSSGAYQLSNGASTLASGAADLDSNSSALVDGSSKLKQATDLIVGKLGDAEKDLDTIAGEVKAVIETGKKYENFAGISDDMKGSVKFIIKTGEVKTEE
ncbi:MAG: hypothetical protein IJJ74_03815 [Eubacterium sp.]|nr:hypothetical protein [Eubacterium sp.]